MFPFIAGHADLREALALLEEARDRLRAEGRPFASHLPVGVNVEVPSAALTADVLAAEVDFLSIGTNDLVQYVLAADRVDPRVSTHYQPLHPAVLRLIRQVVEAAEARSVPVSVCGEMAAEPLHALVLVGLGVRELSLTPVAIPRVKQAVRSVSACQARATVLACLATGTAEDVERLLARELAADASAAEEPKAIGANETNERGRA
jgi:phosphotransferase system enzyme I (PtsI)